ncbi:PRELI family protein, putative [Babesia ovata]|uniref:PRELI family protein, putative n=1 Tax=Babesia ovata TaxID=189622 RepID=A0A2H6KHF0_9APIC|nr:PRELI family protein, putative [Babesia ovata]GBE62401.1 PRELI family protein, putative [Babesia ovata]
MYPSKYYPHVKEVHVIDHEVVPEQRQLRVRRIARVKYDLPSIVRESTRAVMPALIENDLAYVLHRGPEHRILRAGGLGCRPGCSLSVAQNVGVDHEGIVHVSSGRYVDKKRSYHETETIRGMPNGQSECSSSTDFRILAFGFLNSTLEAVARRVVSDFSKTDAGHKALLQAAENLGD